MTAYTTLRVAVLRAFIDVRWRALAKPRDDVVDGHLRRAIGRSHAPQLDLDPLTIGLGVKGDRPRSHPLIAPSAQREDDRLQLQSFLREQVLGLLPGSARLPVLHEPGLDEVLQAL